MLNIDREIAKRTAWTFLSMLTGKIAKMLLMISNCSRFKFIILTSNQPFELK